MDREKINESIKIYGKGKFSKEAEKLTSYLAQHTEFYGYLDGKKVKEGLNERDQALEFAMLIAKDKEIGANPIMWELYWKNEMLDEYRNSKSFLGILRSKMDSSFNPSVVDALKYGYERSVSIMTILFGHYSVVSKIRGNSEKRSGKKITSVKGPVTIALFTVAFLALLFVVLSFSEVNFGHRATTRMLTALCLLSTGLVVYFNNKK